MEVTQSVCVPLRLKVWYYRNGAVAGATSSYGCGVINWTQYGDSPGYYKSRCGLRHDNGTYVNRYAHCITGWVD
jgi:hypothetical protein